MYRRLIIPSACRHYRAKTANHLSNEQYRMSDDFQKPYRSLTHPSPLCATLKRDVAAETPGLTVFAPPRVTLLSALSHAGRHRYAGNNLFAAMLVLVNNK